MSGFGPENREMRERETREPMTKDEIARSLARFRPASASSNRPMGRPATTSGSKTCPEMPEGSRNESTSPFFSMRPRKRPSGPQSTTATAEPRSFGSRSRPAEVPIPRRHASKCPNRKGRLGLRGLGLNLRLRRRDHLPAIYGHVDGRREPAVSAAGHDKQEHLGDRPAADRLLPRAHRHGESPYGDAGGGAYPARSGGSSAPARCNCTGPRARRGGAPAHRVAFGAVGPPEREGPREEISQAAGLQREAIKPQDQVSGSSPRPSAHRVRRPAYRMT